MNFLLSALWAPSSVILDALAKLIGKRVKDPFAPADITTEAARLVDYARTERARDRAREQRIAEARSGKVVRRGVVLALPTDRTPRVNAAGRRITGRWNKPPHTHHG